MLVKFLSIVALGVSAVLALDAPAAFNPPESVLVQRSILQPSPQISARYLTNAERLIAKLPLNPPRRRSRTGDFILFYWLGCSGSAQMLILQNTSILDLLAILEICKQCSHSAFKPSG